MGRVVLNGELDRVRKKWHWPKTRYYPNLRVWSKPWTTSVEVAGLPLEILPGPLPDTSLNSSLALLCCYHSKTLYCLPATAANMHINVDVASNQFYFLNTLWLYSGPLIR